MLKDLRIRINLKGVETVSTNHRYWYKYSSKSKKVYSVSTHHYQKLDQVIHEAVHLIWSNTKVLTDYLDFIVSEGHELHFVVEQGIPYESYYTKRGKLKSYDSGNVPKAPEDSFVKAINQVSDIIGYDDKYHRKVTGCKYVLDGDPDYMLSLVMSIDNDEPKKDIVINIGEDLKIINIVYSSEEIEKFFELSEEGQS